MVYEMKLQDAPFQKIRNGEKKVELRLYDDKRKQLNIGDKIIFSNILNDDKKIAVVVKALYRYGTFFELFEEIMPEMCGFSAGHSTLELVNRVRTYYSEEEEVRHGVLGIKMELIDLQVTLMELEDIKEANFERYYPDGMK